MADIVPTRSALIDTKRKIKLSQTGHKLLKMKRDGLMYELFELLPKVKDIRKNLVTHYNSAQGKMAVAQAIEGRINIKSIAHTQQLVPTVKVGEKNIMGVVVPSVTGEAVRKTLTERGYGIIGTSPQIDDVVDSFEMLVEEIIKAAELETTLKRLLEEIDKTKRRVNALEFKVIPDLEAARDYILLRLEEMERESIFGLKKIKEKARRRAKEEAAARAAALPEAEAAVPAR
ncbi:MAG: V-type ATP synthase subunit D [Euryarchaeota archaeon]|nr:V-type ATP synthase subunit D [Euryarchaeota archaeon]